MGKYLSYSLSISPGIVINNFSFIISYYSFKIWLLLFIVEELREPKIFKEMTLCLRGLILNQYTDLIYVELRRELVGMFLE